MRTEKEILEVFKKELDSFETTGTKIRESTCNDQRSLFQ